MAKNKKYDVSFDLGFSFDVQVKAKTAREAKKKAFQLFVKRHASKMRNYNIAWTCDEDDDYGGEDALRKAGFKL